MPKIGVQNWQTGTKEAKQDKTADLIQKKRGRLVLQAIMTLIYCHINPARCFLKFQFYNFINIEYFNKIHENFFKKC